MLWLLTSSLILHAFVPSHCVEHQPDHFSSICPAPSPPLSHLKVFDQVVQTHRKGSLGFTLKVSALRVLADHQLDLLALEPNLSLRLSNCVDRIDSVSGHFDTRLATVQSQTPAVTRGYQLDALAHLIALAPAQASASTTLHPLLIYLDKKGRPQRTKLQKKFTSLQGKHFKGLKPAAIRSKLSSDTALFAEALTILTKAVDKRLDEMRDSMKKVCKGGGDSLAHFDPLVHMVSEGFDGVEQRRWVLEAQCSALEKRPKALSYKAMSALRLYLQSPTGGGGIDPQIRFPQPSMETLLKDPKWKKLVPRSLLPQVAHTRSKPDTVSGSMVEYDLDISGLDPGEAIEVRVPKAFQGRGLRSVSFSHRQPMGMADAILGKPITDVNPGLTSAQAHRSSIPGLDGWMYWGGSSSGPYGSKFAERRFASKEVDALYEWPLKQRDLTHHQVAGAETVDKVRLVSLGSEAVEVGRLRLNFMPLRTPTKFDRGIFSKGTRFGDPVTLKGIRYGNYNGGSVTLSNSGARTRGSLPKGWQLTKYGLSIPVDSSKDLLSIEVAAGDSKGRGIQGAGFLSLGIKEPHSKIQWILREENVGPHGMYTGSPMKTRFPPGTRIFVSGQGDDLVHVMGVRVGYDN